MGLTIITDDKGTKIFRKDGTSKSGNAYTLYSTKISSKDSSGDWQNMFLDVRFKKGVEVANKATIKIKNAFPTIATWNDTTKMQLMITDFEVIDGGETPQSTPDNGWMDVSVDDGELPFI